MKSSFMNLRSSLLTAVLFTGAFSSLLAQDETDAFRFSNLSAQGTARSISLGGAIGSLGGDFSSLAVNPAGIAVYRRSEFTFTPSIKLNKTNSSYINTATEDNATRFNINNLGVVFTSAQEGKRYERSKWKSVSFGFGVNRTADFTRNYNYSGYKDFATTDKSSGADVFSIDANNNMNDVNNSNAAGTFAYMGYQSYLLDTANGGFFPVTYYTNGVNQQRTVLQKGGITDISISLGGNYEEKFMLGATLGIPTIRFKREIRYKESDPTNNPNNYFDNFEYSENLTTRGSGINLKLGFIYKATDYIRVGLALHSPTYFNLKDEMNSSLVTNTENFKPIFGNYDGPVTRIDAPTNIYEYNLLTPWRAVVSASGIFGKYGFISADYEYVDYASARFDFDGKSRDYQTSVNNTIKSTYKAASILRLGLEGRVQQFSLRLGFGYHSSPYKNSANNGQRVDMSGGLGFRQDNWFLDLGISQSMTELQEQPYSLSYTNPPAQIPTAVIKNVYTNVALTFGVKF